MVFCWKAWWLRSWFKFHQSWSNPLHNLGLLHTPSCERTPLRHQEWTCDHKLVEKHFLSSSQATSVRRPGRGPDLQLQGRIYFKCMFSIYVAYFQSPYYPESWTLLIFIDLHCLFSFKEFCLSICFFHVVMFIFFWLLESMPVLELLFFSYCTANIFQWVAFLLFLLSFVYSINFMQNYLMW